MLTPVSHGRRYNVRAPGIGAGIGLVDSREKGTTGLAEERCLGEQFECAWRIGWVSSLID
jgi:hypothetical protein